jgi:hypothetical protein
MSPDVDDVVYTVSEDAWKGITGGLRRRDRVGVQEPQRMAWKSTRGGLRRRDRWFGETQEVV